jgi:hypothetical protein
MLVRFTDKTAAAIQTYQIFDICISSYNGSQQDALFVNFILIYNSTCFGQTYCPSSGVLILYSQQLVFVILFMFNLCLQTVSINMMDSKSVRNM